MTAETQAPGHYLTITSDVGEAVLGFVCTMPADAPCRRRPPGFDEDIESWTAAEATEPGYPCWATEWVDAAGISDAIVLAIPGVFASIPVDVHYEDGMYITKRAA